MAVDIFLKLDPIRGESLDKTHKNEIDILSWHWGMQQSGTSHLGSGSGGGKVSVQDISFTHFVDKASPELLKCCTTGKHIGRGLLTIRKAGGSALEYIKLDLEDILVSSVNTGGTGSEDRLTENVTLNFRMFTFHYTEQRPDGSGGPASKFGWDIAANEEKGG